MTPFLSRVHDVRMIVDQDPNPGGWKDPETGEVIEDESHRYTVFVPETRVPALRQLLARVANSFDQQVILLCVRGVRVMVERDADAGEIGDGVGEK